MENKYQSADIDDKTSLAAVIASFSVATGLAFVFMVTGNPLGTFIAGSIATRLILMNESDCRSLRSNFNQVKDKNFNQVKDKILHPKNLNIDDAKDDAKSALRLLTNANTLVSLFAGAVMSTPAFMINYADNQRIEELERRQQALPEISADKPVTYTITTTPREKACINNKNDGKGLFTNPETGQEFWVNCTP